MKTKNDNLMVFVHWYTIKNEMNIFFTRTTWYYPYNPKAKKWEYMVNVDACSYLTKQRDIMG